MKLSVLVTFALCTVTACSSQILPSLVGTYSQEPLCSRANEYDLTLNVDGRYRLITTLPEGVGPDLGPGVCAGFEEVGAWHSDGVKVVLKPNDGKAPRALIVSKEGGEFMLADGEIFGLRLKRQRPNQALLPTPTAVTPAASHPSRQP